MLKSDPKNRKGMQEVLQLEDEIEKLKHKYDLYFAGIDNIDPSDKKVRIQRLIARLNEISPRNPRIKFRFQSAAARFVAMNQYWTRICKQIEDGTYKRDLFRANIKRREGSEAKSYFSKTAVQLPPKEGGENAETAQSPVKEANVAATAQPSNPGPATGQAQSQPTSEKKPAGNKGMDLLLDKYVEHRAKQGGDVNIDREDLKKKLRKQAEMLKKKHGAKSVGFKVVTRDGKTSFQPVLKK